MHQKQWEFLKNKFDNDQLSHAYIFEGPDQLGKQFLAKEFIKYIHCIDSLKPCQNCVNCKLIEKENFPDLLVVRSNASTTSLKEQVDNMEIDISQIRSAQNFLSYKSYYGSFKSMIIDNADRMNVEAQSCFLKQLEEPKGKTIMILVTAKPQMLLPTIFSRCQAVKFFLASAGEIKKYLESKNVTEKKAEYLAELSEGKPGRALQFLENSAALEHEQKTLQDLLQVINSDLATKFQYVKKLNLEEGGFNRIMEILQRYFRYLLLQKNGILLKNPAVETKAFTMGQIKKIITLIEDLILQASVTNTSPKLALAILLMEI